MLAIEASNLEFAYSGQPLVIDIDSFVLEKGEKVFLHGPSGSGKTTFLGLLCGILRGHAGDLRILGEDFGSMPANRVDAFRGAHIGYIFQMFNLLPFLNVRENVSLACNVNRERRSRIRPGELEEICGRLGLGELLDKSVRQLSVGQQQRVAAARSLLGSPEIIVADEPTSALDSDRRDDFLRLLFSEAERVGAAVLFVSHDRGLAASFDRSLALAEINKVAG